MEHTSGEMSDGWVKHLKLENAVKILLARPQHKQNNHKEGMKVKM
jgi:hypothetical protein